MTDRRRLVGPERLDLHRYHAIRDGILAAGALLLVLFGPAIIDWIDPGRVDRRIEAEHQMAPIDREICQAFGTCPPERAP